MQSAPLKGLTLMIATICLSLATFMQILDTSIANVAIPYIAGDLGVSTNQGTWVITSFAVGSAISLPLTGEITRRLGAVKTIVLAVILFTLLSWLCGFAPTFPFLVTCRFFQGVVSGPLIPLAQALLMLIYPKEKTTFALSIFTMIAVVGPILGPILGGWFTENYTWHWIFYINIPFGIISALGCSRALKNFETPKIINPFDYWGLALLILSVGSLQIMLDKGEQLDWFGSSIIIFLCVISSISFVFLLIREWFHDKPLLELSLFKNRNFALGTFITSLSYMCFFGAVVITPLWLQTQMGYTALSAGLAVAPMGIIPVFFSMLLPKLLSTFNIRWIILTCFLMLGAVYLLFAHLATNVSFAEVATLRLLFGIPLAIYFTPLVKLTMSQIPPEKFSSAAGIFNFCRIFMGGAGTSIFVYLWDRRAAIHHAKLVEHLVPNDLGADTLMKPIEALGLGQEASFEIANQIVDQQAFMLASNDVFFFAATLCLLLTPLVFLCNTKSPKDEKNKTVTIAD
ncbi:MAG: DHA2 family efflux MFS transporter permease subunit [Parachlamydiales bacterium]|nr:DHA2 family efflux MFS transporter permease subunit [Parachlamydiales bacterium]